MKHFILKILTHSLLITLLLIPLSFSYIYFSKQKAESYQLNKNTTDVFIGDSHIEYAIQDSILPNMQNLGLNSEALYYSYHKLKSIVKTNKSISTVYLGLSYHSISEYYDDFVFGHFSEHTSSRYFNILPKSEQVTLLKKNKSKLLPYLRKIIKESHSIYNNNPVYIGKYYNQFNNTKAVDSSIKKRIKFQYYNNKTIRPFSKNSLQYLANIVQFCGDNNIKLIVLNTPLHPLYKEQVPKLYKDKYLSLLKEFKLTSLKFPNIKLIDSDFIPDGDHLSVQGAGKISQAIKNKNYTLE